MTLAEDWDVSRETSERIGVFRELLEAWNRRINLVSPKDIENLDQRHIQDSIQIYRLVDLPVATWVDLGSGAGFPGLICAILDLEYGNSTHFHLIEADTRKAAFLQETARLTGINATVVPKRIEAAPSLSADIITARALAPLTRLCEYAVPFSHPETLMIFPKGAQSESELTAAQQAWHITCRRVRSSTDPVGTILMLTKVSPRT